MEVIDYNGDGRWSRVELLARYDRYVEHLHIARRDLSPVEYSERGRHWVYPVMSKVIAGIEAGDAACIRIGLEFIEEDTKFAFGKILKAKTARALRRASLTDGQKQRIRNRVFALMEAGHIPHEFREYAKLVRKIGSQISDIPEPVKPTPYTRSDFKPISKQSKHSAARPEGKNSC